MGYLRRELGAELFAHEYGVSMHEMAKTVVYSLHSLLQKAFSLEKAKPFEKEIKDLMFRVQRVFSLKMMKGSQFNVQLVNSQ